MGTPALLTIEQDGHELYFRRHYDGYPEHVLPNLAPVLCRIRAIVPKDPYGLRIADVAALVAWVGVQEEKIHGADRENLCLPPFGKMSTWLPINSEWAEDGYFCYYYTLNLETKELTYTESE
jgi:hypothetical protein